MTPAAGLWGLVAGTAAALVTYVGYKWAGLVHVRLRPRRVVLGRGRGVRRRRGRHRRRDAVTKPKPVEELQGLVWGMANEEDAATATVHDKWWESPELLGFGAIALGRHPDDRLLLGAGCDERPGDQRANEREQGTGTREAQAANLFDLRRIIGGLFVLYGVVLTIVGLGDSDAEIAKAAGVRINLSAGLGMLALGLLLHRVGAAAAAGQAAAGGRAQAGGAGRLVLEPAVAAGYSAISRAPAAARPRRRRQAASRRAGRAPGRGRRSRRRPCARRGAGVLAAPHGGFHRVGRGLVVVAQAGVGGVEQAADRRAGRRLRARPPSRRRGRSRPGRARTRRAQRIGSVATCSSRRLAEPCARPSRHAASSHSARRSL